MKKRMIEILLVAALLFGVFSYRIINNKVEQEIMKKGKLAIGTVIGAGKTGWYSRGSISFSFYCGKQKVVKPLSKYPSDIRVKRDEKYLVVYLENNQKKAIILFDYPVKDSTDFKRYVKESEQIRKKRVKE